MKKIYLVFILTALIVATLTTAGFISVNKKAKPPVNLGFAVVELFTSEGCSSCPSAEETVARLNAKNLSNVYILAFHVDYWDRLGWKDPFSESAYSKRQNEYASKFNLSSVYTPQVIVNGVSEFVGSDENKLANAIAGCLQKQPVTNLGISAKRTDNAVAVNYNITGGTEVLLNFAFVEPEATSAVTRGENRGRTLHHVNVVRFLKTINATGNGSVNIELSRALNGLPLRLITYTQAKNNLQILAADEKPID